MLELETQKNRENQEEINALNEKIRIEKETASRLQKENEFFKSYQTHIKKYIIS